MNVRMYIYVLRMYVYVCMYVFATCTSAQPYPYDTEDTFKKIFGRPTLKFWTPEGRQEASSTLMTHKYKNYGTKFCGPKLHGSWDLCAPGTGEDVSAIVSAHFVRSYWGVFSLLCTLLCKLNYGHASALGGPE
jgi:hypothetical protein